MNDRDDNTNEFAELRLDAPRLSDEAMARVEAAMRAELDAAYPVGQSDEQSEQSERVERAARASAPARSTVLFTFRQFASIAAMLALVIILAWHVTSPTPLTPPRDPRLADAQPTVVETLRIHIETPDAAAAPGQSPLETVFTSVDRHESILGVSRYARR